MAQQTADGDVTPHRDRYALVFALLIVSYLASALVTSPRARTVTLLLFVAALLIALRSAHLSGRLVRRTRWVMITGSVAAVAVATADLGAVADGAVSIWVAVITATTVVVVVRRVMHHDVITLQTVFGALSGYLLIGFTFAALFSATASFEHAPFFAGGQRVTGVNLQYFSFVTLTTTGYGDLTAATNAGQALAVMDALLGQIFLVTLVARLVAVFGTARRTVRVDGSPGANGPVGPNWPVRSNGPVEPGGPGGPGDGGEPGTVRRDHEPW
jgi:hypothetical protein